MTRTNLLRAAGAGLAAGLAGACAMELWQSGASSLMATAAKAKGEPSEGGASATEKAADAVSEAVRGHPVADDGKTEASRRVHYATGAALGLAYGVTVELWPGAAAGFGGGLALASMVALDEGLVPALGFGPPPQRTPPAMHGYSLFAHLVYGVATEAARRLLGGRIA